MCQVDILLVISDVEMNKLIEYNSGTRQTGLFTLDKTIQAYNEVKCRAKRYEFYRDEVYDRFVNGKQKEEMDMNEGSSGSQSIQMPILEDSSTDQIFSGSMANI